MNKITKKRNYTLITGSAGFIGYHLACSLIKRNKHVIGIDNLNNYYSVKLKKDRIKDLKKIKKKYFIFHKVDLSNKKKIENLFKKYKITEVINLAAQAGVRYSITNPEKYLKSNIIGFHNLISCSIKAKVKMFIYASTSSVYGKITKTPFNENLNCNNPIQLYAATKLTNELIAHAYSHLYNFLTIGLRFFTVYGPWGRPDMALFKFVDAMKKKKKINVFNYGKHYRDFTYIDDVIKAIVSIKTNFRKKFKNKKNYEIYNIGNNKPVFLRNYINEIEKNLKIRARINYLPLQPGDIFKTQADTKKLRNHFNYKSKTDYKKGVKKFVDWHNDYYRKN